MGSLNCKNAKHCGHTVCIELACRNYTPHETTKQTNEDRIRTEIATTEGLADLLVNWLDDWGEFQTPIGHIENYEEAITKTVEWLKKPAEGEIN